jgi:crotonobetainyl-CoA:carnitine CoA-transferase CaiB-like acyl-CoA transferase
VVEVTESVRTTRAAAVDAARKPSEIVGLDFDHHAEHRPRALDGVRVVDLSVGIAGPLAGMMLADHGADVVKVEPDPGDPARSRAGFHVWNRGKRAVGFDPGVDEDWRWLRNLVCHADLVLVGTSSPGVTYEMLSARGLTSCRSAVWLVLSPYLLGSTPWTAQKESASLLYAALGHAWNQGSYEEAPIDCVYPIPLYVQGLWAATVAVAALAGRARGWRPEGAFSIGGAHCTVIASPGAYLAKRDAPVVERLGGPLGALPNYRCYQCKDGRWLFLGAYNDRFVERALDALGLRRLLADSRLGGDPGRVRLAQNFTWLDENISAALKSRTRREWLIALEAADVPVAPILSRDEWPGHPQVRALGLMTQSEPYARTGIEMPGVPLLLSDTPGCVATSAPDPPAPGERVEWRERVRQLPEGGERRRGHKGLLPLDGVRAVDLGTVIAGPYAGTLLGDLGCEVMKVERPPNGDDARVIHGGPGRSGFAVYNRRQRSVVVDLRDERGKEVFSKILGSTDVVIENFRPQVSSRLGLEWESLRSRFPSLSLVSITAYGSVGPFNEKPGFDPIVQALSGIMRAQGGGDETASPAMLTVPINDVVASLLAAFGTCASLFAREHIGHGQRVEVSLAGAATLLQSEELVSGVAAALRPRRQGGRDYRGHSPLNRYYETQDGWVFVDGQYPDDVGALVEAGVLDDVADLSCEGGIAQRLSAAFGGTPSADVVSKLNEAGVPAVRARKMGDLVHDAFLLSRRVLQPVVLDATGVRWTGPGRWWEVVGEPDVRDVGSSSELKLGGATYEVLREIGIADEEISELSAGNAVLIAEERQDR